MKKFFLLLCITYNLYTTNIILIGPPGSGKGTLSQFFTTQHDYHQICPGDIFRKHIREQTELGNKIKPIVENGDYVDQDITCDIIFSEIETSIAHQQHFIVDGFPRSDYCLEKLESFLSEKDISQVACIHLDASDDICLQRILQRQVCTQCNHVTTLQKSPNQQCPNCNTYLSKRQFDIEETTRKRIAYYREHIEPLISKISKWHDIKYIDTSDKTIEECLDCYKELSEQL